ncbi:MAG: redox-sensitive bicupin YhaK (pirin superfamily) [Crocinitomix sp.]|jgi:redox-sensitive bicupin YhaK (pirin superfamily)
MNQKLIKYSLPAITIDMGGLPLKQPLPYKEIEQVDPFLLLHHARFKAVKNRPPMQQGVGPHPHRGFSPVTFVLEGEIHHRDSRGNSQIAKKGEVQWMHAGLGIIHSERPSEFMALYGGRQEIIQLWINSPANKKMIEPAYLHLDETEMPNIQSTDKKVNLRLVAGNYNNETVRSIAQSELLILWGTAAVDGKCEIKIPANYSALCYLISGACKLEGDKLTEKETLVVFEEVGETVFMEFTADSEFLILAGLPIAEEVTKHGPFVMNTQTEIMEAMRDYQMGKMGVLIENEL